MSNPFDIIDSRLSNIENILLDLKREPVQQKTASLGDELLTVKSCAQLLDLSVQTVYQLVHKRKIPFLKPPGSSRVYFNKAEILSYLKRGKVKTELEIQSEADAYTQGKKKRV